jgi:hypothetical protein
MVTYEIQKGKFTVKKRGFLSRIGRTGDAEYSHKTGNVRAK